MFNFLDPNSYINLFTGGAVADFFTTAGQSLGSTTAAITGNIGQVAQDAGWEMVSKLFDFMPDGGGFPAIFHEAAIYFGNCLQSVAFMVPVEALVQCLTISMSVLFTLAAFHIVRIVVNFVRGIPTDPYNIRNW